MQTCVCDVCVCMCTYEGMCAYMEATGLCHELSIFTINPEFTGG